MQVFSPTFHRCHKNTRLDSFGPFYMNKKWSNKKRRESEKLTCMRSELSVLIHSVDNAWSIADEKYYNQRLTLKLRTLNHSISILG